MKRIIARIWSDQRGEASSMALILLTTLLALGSITALVTLRNQIVQEMGDFALALENINQSYTSATATFTDPGPFPTDPANDPPACLDLTVPPP